MTLEAELEYELQSRGADFVYFTDISHLPDKQNRNYPRAILFGIALSTEYIQLICGVNQIGEDEFHVTEARTDQLADSISGYLSIKGYSAHSQSENNLFSSGCYNESTKSSALPHKTIAGLAGLGWIGKHNLLVNPEFGSAISMCTVLTDAPLKTVLHTPVSPECGDCTICQDICPVNAIKGIPWKMGALRDELLDVFRCTSCLKCLALCPWTQKYAEQNTIAENK